MYSNYSNKSAKMALDRSPEFLRLLYPFFFVVFREEFTRICLCSYSQVAPIHQSHVHGQIKILLTIFGRGHSRKISVNWELEAIYSVVLID